jgi:uncharacterized protein YecT (DUF1311 family)
MISLAILAAATSVAAAPAPCPGDTTRDIEACLGQQFDAANATLARYVAAARTRIAGDMKDEGPDSAPTLADFDKAETQWSAYRKAECGAIYDEWMAGTIRGTMELNCEIFLTRQHTYVVWSEWLTYMDDTPPILPEPPKN